MFTDITLETGLKPFKKTTDEYIQKICQKVFEQWTPLLKNRETVSIMMWSADGSELLDYTGDPDREFEWCRYVGTANNPLVEDMPLATSLHERKQLYMENPPKMTYRILRKIVSTFKDEGAKHFPDAKIQVGTTFDIGPEFAVSDFKYNRHKEACSGSGCDCFGFVDATALLHGDAYQYAAYPDGLPDKTPMGTLLGAQANIFMRDMGFDFIWLSNGMGFCFEPWNETGKIYDGKSFHPNKLADTRKNIFQFWKLFRDACPDYPIRTRGTNFSVGIDYATDGVPLYDIYNGDFNITPPPNSPWAALNDDIGIEILGQLTRNCELPGKDYMFRFYLHDMWWMNSPWYDRYEGYPYDIYIPMALARIDENGKVHTPSLLNILSIDNSMGDMPDICANEVIPHILKAEKDAPDRPSPLVLVYPFKEYTTATEENMLREMYFGDMFIKNALNAGFPLATVVSSDNFAKHSTEIYDESILVVPGTLCCAAQQKLRDYAHQGGRIIAYGSNTALDNVEYPCQKADIYGDTKQLFDAMSGYGYSIQFIKEPGSPLPSMTVHRSNNAMIFSVYNRDTTVETALSFPLGAPILNGFNAKIADGHAHYHFNRCVHTECHVFVKQHQGIVRAREQISANKKYRRKIQISGLDNAEVCLFGEEYCKDSCIVACCEPDGTPVPLPGWEVICDEHNGTYLHGKNVSGTITLCMPNKQI